MIHRPMRLWLRGPRFRRRAPHAVRPIRAGRRGVHLLLSAVLGVGLALLAIHLFESSLRPMVIDMAEAQVQNRVTQIMSDTVSDTLTAEAVAYDDIVTLQKDNSGRITAMTTSPAKMNALRSALLESIVAQVEQLDTDTLGIPLWNLTGLVSTSGHGPLLPVQVATAAAPNASFHNVFTNQGINQTLHQVMLDINVTVKLFIPGGTVEQIVSAQVCIAETIIVGEVPQAYLQMDTP